MAGLIVKSSYYKCGGNATLSGYLRYIATRPRAERLGYDSAKAWRDLLRAHRNDIAAAINIPPNDFRWYAAFHDEGDHSPCPHDGVVGKAGTGVLVQRGNPADQVRARQ